MNTAKPARKIPAHQFTEAKRRDFLNTCLEEFLKVGFADCSIDHLSRVTGVTKMTIYRHYAGKDEIFQAAAVATMDSMSLNLDNIVIDLDNPASGLRKMAQTFLQHSLTPAYREMWRLVLAESPRRPELMQSVRAELGRTGLGKLAEVFELLRKNEALNPALQSADAIDIANDFGNMTIGGFRYFFDLQPSAAELKRRINRVVGLFLKP
jgi:AcrR family transcriptional regulator